MLARREDKTVIGGHQRLTAARRLGYKTVPVIFLDITLEQARLLNLSLNKISGDWDNELLSRLLADLAPVDGLDLSLSGFSDDELKKLLKGVESREKRDRLESFDLDAALEAARAAPRAQRGELWALGDHRLLVGDACDAGDVSRLFGDAKAAMAFDDPPYNVSLGDHGGQQRGQKRRRLENDSLSPVEWETFVPPLVPQPPAVHGRRHLHLHVHQGVAARLTRAAEEGGHWSDTIIWAKDRFVLGRADYQRQYEPIWYGWREGVQHHWNGDRDQGDVWSIERPSVSEAHPTQKPLPLMERAIENSSQPGDLVYGYVPGFGLHPHRLRAHRPHLLRHRDRPQLRLHRPHALGGLHGAGRGEALVTPQAAFNSWRSRHGRDGSQGSCRHVEPGLNPTWVVSSAAQAGSMLLGGSDGHLVREQHRLRQRAVQRRSSRSRRGSRARLTTVRRRLFGPSDQANRVPGWSS